MRYAKGHKASSHERILNVAVRKFRRRGIAGAGMTGIMAAAGLTNGAFYSHFGSKSDLVREGLERALDEQLQRLDEADAAPGELSQQKGTIIFTNASAALKGYPSSGAFAMACHAKSGLAQSMARELMPQGIHVANVPIDAAIGWTQEDGTRAHRLAGTTVDDNMADPDRIAETYLQLHRQHRSTWAFEVVLRPWVERW